MATGSELWGKITSIWTLTWPHAMKSIWRRKAEPIVGGNAVLIYESLDPAMPEVGVTWDFSVMGQYTHFVQGRLS